MSQNIKYILGFIISFLLFIGGLFTYKSCQKCPEPPKYRTEKQIIDSMLKVIPRDTTYIIGKGKVIYRDLIDTNYIFIKDSMLFAKVFENDNVYWDSIPIPETYQYILSKPFESCLDTICQKDTVKVCYEYPANYLSVLYKPHPDSIYVKTINNYIVEEKHWYFGVGMHLGTGWSGGQGLTGQLGIGVHLGYKIGEW